MAEKGVDQPQVLLEMADGTGDFLQAPRSATASLQDFRKQSWD